MPNCARNINRRAAPVSPQACVLLTLVGALAVYAQTCPNLTFEGASSTSLKPSASTHIQLIRQSDGSYTAFEMTDASPHRLVRTTPNFQNQFTGCPAPPAAGGIPSLQAPEILTRLNWGGYLWVRRSDLYLGNGAYGYLNVTVFDASMKLLSEAQYPAAIVEALAVADINGDGLPDVLAASAFPHSSGLQVLLGNGGSTFQPAVSYSLGSSLFISAMVLADLNGDGRDVVIGSGSNPIDNKISVLLGNGDGTFQPESTAFSALPLLRSVAVADLNGDGKPDLVSTIYPYPSTNGPPLAVALGAGDGTFGAVTRYPVGGSDSVAIADMNGDGIPDIVTSGFTILFGDGQGGFPKRADYLQQVAGSLILTDFNGDGIADIVVGNGTANFIAGPAVAVLFGRGGGSFGSPPVSLVSASTGARRIIPADFDGDGKPDVAVLELEELNILLGNGDGSFRETFHYSPGAFPEAIAVADFNSDGQPDIAAAFQGRIEVLFGKGDGTFSAPVVTTPADQTVPDTGLAIGDWNGDGRPDLATLSVAPIATPTSGQVLIHLGNGGGTFAPPTSYSIGAFPESMAIGDFNRDGKLDLAITSAGAYVSQTLRTGGGLTILFGKGDGSFAAPVSVPLGIENPIAGGVAAADFNLDGVTDLAVTLPGRLVVLIGRGDGTFTPTSYDSSYDAHTLFAADLNGDGIPDLLSRDATIWGLGNGDGTFQAETVYANIGPVAAADFNRDGRLDLLVGRGDGVAPLLNLSQPSALTIVSTATFAPGPLAADSLATAFGHGFAPDSILSVAGISATILYKSPTQVNFWMPSTVPLGPATVNLISSKGSLSAPVTIASVAPALFQGYLLSPVGDQLYLSLFGTGIRGAPPGQVSVRIQGLEALVTFAGPQGKYTGLDQVNVLVPPELSGTRDASVVLTAAGVQAPSIYIKLD